MSGSQRIAGLKTKTAVDEAAQRKLPTMMSLVRRARSFFAGPITAADLVGSPFTPRSGDHKVHVSVFGEILRFDRQVVCDGFSNGDSMQIPVCVVTTFDLGAEIDVTLSATDVTCVNPKESIEFPVISTQLSRNCSRSTISASATRAGTAVLMTWEIPWRGPIDVEISVTVRGQRWRFDNTLFCDEYGSARPRDVYQYTSTNPIILLRKVQSGFERTRVSDLTQRPSSLLPVDVAARVEYATTHEPGVASKRAQLRELTFDEVV